MLKRIIISAVILVIFSLASYCEEKERIKIKFLGEAAIYPDRILKSVDFDDLYKIPQFSFAVALFQNNLNRKLNNGFLGINFNSPIKIKFVTINDNITPDIVVEWTLDNIEKFKTSIGALSQGSVSLYPLHKIYALGVKSGNGLIMPAIINNKKICVICDMSNIGFFNSLQVKQSLEKAADTSPARFERASLILKEIYNSASSSQYSAAGNLPTEIQITKSDILSYFFTNITGDYLEKFYQQFKLEFIKELIENESLSKQALTVQKSLKSLQINNYVFPTKKSADTEIKIERNPEFAANINSDVFLFFMSKGDSNQLKKILNNKRIFADNTEFSKIKEQLLSVISAFNGEIYFYINPNNENAKNTEKNFDFFNLKIQ